MFSDIPTPQHTGALHPLHSCPAYGCPDPAAHMPPPPPSIAPRLSPPVQWPSPPLHSCSLSSPAAHRPLHPSTALQFSYSPAQRQASWYCGHPMAAHHVPVAGWHQEPLAHLNRPQTLNPSAANSTMAPNPLQTTARAAPQTGSHFYATECLLCHRVLRFSHTHTLTAVSGCMEATSAVCPKVQAAAIDC
jgi:hypothetical protein